MEKRKPPSGRLRHIQRDGSCSQTAWHKLFWSTAVSALLLYTFPRDFSWPLGGQLSEMTGWKLSTVGAGFALNSTSQSMRMYNLSDIAWTVGNEALNISVP